MVLIIKSSAEYNQIRAMLEKEGIYVPRDKLNDLLWLKEFEEKHQKHDGIKRFFVANPKPTKFGGVKFSLKSLARVGGFGIYVLPYKEASRDMKNPTRHYIW